MESAPGLSAQLSPALGIADQLREETSKPFAWHLSMALSRPLYTVFLFAGACMVLYPRAFSTLYGGGSFKSHWKGLLALVLIEVLIVDFICKRHLRWPRPTQPHRNGFPSGHATFSFALATMLGILYPVLSPLFFALAGAVGWARFYLQAHYLYQVCGGGILGMCLGMAMAHIR